MAHPDPDETPRPQNDRPVGNLDFGFGRRVPIRVGSVRPVGRPGFRIFRQGRGFAVLRTRPAFFRTAFFRPVFFRLRQCGLRRDGLAARVRCNGAAAGVRRCDVAGRRGLNPHDFDRRRGLAGIGRAVIPGDIRSACNGQRDEQQSAAGKAAPFDRLQPGVILSDRRLARFLPELAGQLSGIEADIGGIAAHEAQSVGQGRQRCMIVPLQASQIISPDFQVGRGGLKGHAQALARIAQVGADPISVRPDRRPVEGKVIGMRLLFHFALLPDAPGQQDSYRVQRWSMTTS